MTTTRWHWGLELAKAGPDPEVVLEATYGWYWAVDVLAAAGARVHLAHPLGVKGFAYRRVIPEGVGLVKPRFWGGDLCFLVSPSGFGHADLRRRGQWIGR